MALTTIKLSIILLYRRIFPVPSLHKVIYYMAAYIVIWQIFQTLDSIFACNPVRGYWDHSLRAKCRDELVEIIIGGVQNIVTDIIILCLPMPILWTLQTSKQRKIQLTGLFALGGLVCLISIIRVTQLSNTSLIDPSWSAVGISTWSAAELAAGIISACLPVLRPIYTSLFHSTSHPHNEAAGFPGVPSKPTSSVDVRRKPFAFWWTPWSSDLASSSNANGHLISTLNSAHGIDGDGWAERPISRILSIYQRMRSGERESTATMFTDLEEQGQGQERTQSETGIPTQGLGRVGSHTVRSGRVTGKRRPGMESSRSVDARYPSTLPYTARSTSELPLQDKAYILSIPPPPPISQSPVPQAEQPPPHVSPRRRRPRSNHHRGFQSRSLRFPPKPILGFWPVGVGMSMGFSELPSGSLFGGFAYSACWVVGIFSPPCSPTPFSVPDNFGSCDGYLGGTLCADVAALLGYLGPLKGFGGSEDSIQNREICSMSGGGCIGSRDLGSVEFSVIPVITGDRHRIFFQRNVSGRAAIRISILPGGEWAWDQEMLRWLCSE
ncbi:hypothetical protein G7Y79_00044g080570 [Physcia stellaris]|nr:hypothetical protein G7Y79_00044g080570 [Physcia stellaris]